MKKNLVGVAQDGSDLAGFGWLTDIEPKKAMAHFAVFREYWGGNRSLEVTKALNTYFLTIPAEDGFLIDMLWGLTDKTNRYVIRHIEKSGGIIVGELPFGIWSAKTQSAVPAIISYITREQVIKNG
jgi:hypothetical protein